MRVPRCLLGLAPLLLVAGCGDPGGADVAVVVCEQEGARVEPAEVRTWADGVHLRVENMTEGERMLLLDQHGSELVPAGATAMIRTVPPGEVRVACVGPIEPETAEDVDGEGGLDWPYPGDDEWVVLEVVDLDGFWTDDTLACEHPVHSHGDYLWDLTDVPMPEGERGDLIDLAERDLPRELGEQGIIRQGDVVEAAGYQDVSGRMRLVRNGEAVAIIWYRPDGRGGWHPGGVEYCDDWESAVPEPAPGDQEPKGSQLPTRASSWSVS